MFAQLRHAIAVVFFGFVIPLIAFTIAYPGGPSDMYNKAIYPIQMSRYQTTVLKLPGSFSLSELEYYVAAAVDLMVAKPGERIVLTIDENLGGAVSLLDVMTSFMTSSKAHVTTVPKDFALSCGTNILFYGNETAMPYGTLLLFHTGYLTDESGNTHRVTPNSEYAKVREIYAETIKRDYPLFSRWLSKANLDKYMAGQDVFVTGYDLCNHVDGNHPPVLFQYAGGCVIKGLKP